jgi:hypothetical protein
MAAKAPTRVEDKTQWPLEPEQIELVRAQLERMLTDPLFSQSRRYPRLLRRIVEDSLAGEVSNLKERVLGIELFERAPDYDTNADAIVRVTAAELRKRIAQYYHEAKHQQEPRIDLPVGGYVAAFRPPPTIAEAAPPPVADPVIAAPVVSELETPDEILPIPPSRLRFYGPWAVIGVLVILALGLIAWVRHPESTDALWQSFISKGASPLLCVGQLPVSAIPQGPQDSLARSLLGQRPVSISDAVVVSQFATYLGSRGITPRIQVSTATSYLELRRHPVLLIGGLDNSWTLRFLDGLRYRMRARPDSSVLSIYDSADPSKDSPWEMDFSKPPDHVVEDYAIVSRFYSSETESTVMIAAGLGENGTDAATDFLLHSQYLRDIEPANQDRWKTSNMELVLKTQIIDGHAGPPVIAARYFW